MPKSRDPGRPKPSPGAYGVAQPPPEQAEVERAIGRVLDRLKPRMTGPKLDRKPGRTASR